MGVALVLVGGSVITGIVNSLGDDDAPTYERTAEEEGDLRQQLTDAVHAYARGIHVDREAIERGLTEAMGSMEGGIDPSDPESIQRLLGSGLL